MVDVGIITGSKEQARELVIGKDKVYVHSDIKKIETEMLGKPVEIYEYHEIQYDKDEYLELMVQSLGLAPHKEG